MTSKSSPARTVGRLLGVLATLLVAVAGVAILFPDPLADVFFTGWLVLGVALALVGGVAAWTSRTTLVWLVALLLAGLAIVGMWSIGFFVGPAALLMLASAVILEWTETETDGSTADSSAQATVQKHLLKMVAGAGFVAVGGGLIYVGAFVGELFGACANENVACVVNETHWDAVGMTVVGLIVAGVGGRLLWKQVAGALVVAGR